MLARNASRSISARAVAGSIARASPGRQPRWSRHRSSAALQSRRLARRSAAASSLRRHRTRVRGARSAPAPRRPSTAGVAAPTAGGQHGGAQPAEHVAGAGLTGPGRPGHARPRPCRSSGRGHQLGRALEQHRRTGAVDRRPGPRAPGRRSPGPLHAEQPGQLPGVRGQQPGARAPRRAGAAGRRRRPPPAAPSRAPRPSPRRRRPGRPSPSRPARPAPGPATKTTFGSSRADDLRRPRAPRKRTIRRPRAPRRTSTARRRPGSGRSRCRSRPPPGRTCRCVASGYGQAAATSSASAGRQRRASRRSGPSPMSTSSICAGTGCAPARSGDRAWLAEGHRPGRPGPSRAGHRPVSASTPDGRSTATTGIALGQPAARRGHRPAAPAGRRCRACRRPPGRPGQVADSPRSLDASTSRPPAASSAASPPACGLPRQRTAVTAAPRGPAGRRRTARRRRCCPGPTRTSTRAPYSRAPRSARAARRDRRDSPWRGALHQRVVADRRDGARPPGRGSAPTVVRVAHGLRPRRPPRPRRSRRRGTSETWMVPTPSSRGPVGDRAGDHEDGPAAPRR